MGFGDVGYNGSEIATPNLDQMAQQGMKLDRNYVYPVCSPTRAALLSGQNPLHMGITGPIDDKASLPENLKIMPEYFKDIGYETYMVGKWHLGLSKTSAWPSAKGFDSYYGFLGGWIDFYTHVFAGGLDWQRDGVTVNEEGHATDLMTDEALRIIESDHGKPFLMYLAYNAPHSPIQHPPSYSGLNNFDEVTNRSVYAEMVTHMDAGIGQIMQSLKDQQLLENTIVIFSSDNGGAIHLGANNGELREGKRSAFDGGIRVPGLINWPGKIASGSTLEQPIAVHDWLPTLLEAVGGDVEDISNPYGQSMWPAISEGVQISKHPVVIGAVGSLGVIKWPYKLVAITDEESNTTTHQLFNVVNDPTEQTDLSVELHDLTQSLVAQIDAMPEPEVNRLEPEFNNSPRYFDRNIPDHDQRHEAIKEPWAESAIRD
ncbi:UNVERIFIED_CONTAM: hypothetical protein GTU68_059404 [Idotea baltica]|nr:hypothetical protein [Idotea baltica]